MALQDCPDVHAALPHTMLSPGQINENYFGLVSKFAVPALCRKLAWHAPFKYLAIFTAHIKRLHYDVLHFWHLHVKLQVTGAVHVKLLHRGVEEESR